MVYQVVKMIPPGRVTSYGAIARYLGDAKSARMVGWAMNASHNTDSNIPAHRVVNRNGLLTGLVHFFDPAYMQRALEQEGIRIQENRVINLDEHFWDPMVELSL